MLISPSQLVNALSCYRKWWFRTIMKIKDNKDPAARDYGTILHACAERWLNADDQGRDRNTGQPVDPFPTGWEEVFDFGKPTGRKLSRMEQALVRVLFKQAVDNGALRRLPGRLVESHFVIEVIPGVKMQGYIDQDSEFVVEDHKTTKHKGYALSPAKLHDDDKMLCYAHVRKLRRAQALAKTPITLRLNYFSKAQDREPWAVEVNVSPEFVEKFWQEKVTPTAKTMLELSQAKIALEDWSKIEGPNKKGACEDYGGCPYAEICSRMTTVERYLATQARKNQPKEEKKKGTMSFFKKRSAVNSAPSPDQPLNTPEVDPPTPGKPLHIPGVVSASHEPDSVPTPAQPEKVVLSKMAPPWAVPGCNPCKGTGINSKGNPCGACDLVSGRTGGKTSKEFKVWVDDSGDLRWAPADGAPIVKSRIEEAAKVMPAKDQAAPTPAPAPKVDIPTEKAAQEPKPKEKAKEKAKEAGPSKGRFRLFIGCAPLSGQTLDLTDILAKEGKELAAASGQESYYQLDAFKRRDALAAQAPAIADALAGQNVTTTDGALTPDERTLLAALQPFAELVVVRR